VNDKSIELTTTREIQATSADSTRTSTQTTTTPGEIVTDTVIRDFKIEILDDLIAKSLNSSTTPTTTTPKSANSEAAMIFNRARLRHEPAWTTFVLVAVIGVLVLIIVGLIFSNRR
jgi:hypothetical protein